MKDLLTRLTSRKLWLAVAGLITLAANDQWTEFTVALLAYLGVEGSADVAKNLKKK